jgi:uridine monophosphate synthetase
VIIKIDNLMDELRKKVATGLFTAGAIKFGSFRLKLHDKYPNAPLSPFYIDIRIIRSFPDLIEIVTDLYFELLSTFAFDLLADVPTAATPIVAVLSYKTKIPIISPRLDTKTHGFVSEIDGRYNPEQKVVLVDDVITLAESKLSAIAVLEKSGLLVQGVVVLIDREQGGMEELRGRGYTCRAAYTITELLFFYHQAGMLNIHIYNSCIDYLKNPY